MVRVINTIKIIMLTLIIKHLLCPWRVRKVLVVLLPPWRSVYRKSSPNVLNRFVEIAT